MENRRKKFPWRGKSGFFGWEGAWGEERSERLPSVCPVEEGQDELRDRIKTLEVEHKNGCVFAPGHGRSEQ